MATMLCATMVNASSGLSPAILLVRSSDKKNEFLSKTNLLGAYWETNCPFIQPLKKVHSQKPYTNSAQTLFGFLAFW
jgi:hypothetical protein